MFSCDDTILVSTMFANNETENHRLLKYNIKQHLLPIMSMSAYWKNLFTQKNWALIFTASTTSSTLVRVGIGFLII